MHVPFCTRKCRYCAFYSVPLGTDGKGGSASRLLDAYVAAVEREARLRAGDCMGGRFPAWDTVYFGGGTPTLLGPERIGRILEALCRAAPLSPAAEVTVEANPGTVSACDLPRYRDAGVSRLSIGLQSLSDPHLAWLGRIHTAADGLRLLQSAKAAGFSTGIDLIYGLPGQEVVEWCGHLRLAAKLGPDHVSCYALTVEGGTRLCQEVESGQVRMPDQDASAALFLATHETLAAAGYPGYEVSNFARDPCVRSRHNRACWSHEPYLGLGPGAHSFDGRCRSWNLPDLNAYLAFGTAAAKAAGADLAKPRPAPGCASPASRSVRPPHESEVLRAEQILLEHVMLALRTAEGIDLARCRSITGADIADRCSGCARQLEEEGLLRVDERSWRPTLAGLAVADALPLRLLEGW